MSDLYWDEVLVTHDRENTSVEVSFKKIDGDGFLLSSGDKEPGTPGGTTEGPDGTQEPDKDDEGDFDTGGDDGGDGDPAPPGGPVPGDNPECGSGPDCSLAPIWLAENGYLYHLDLLEEDPNVLNPKWSSIGTANSTSGTRYLFDVTGLNGVASGWMTYDSSDQDKYWGALSDDVLEYLTDNYCSIPSRLPGFPSPLIATANPSQNRSSDSASPEPLLLGTQVSGDYMAGYFVLLIETSGTTAGKSMNIGLHTSTRVVAITAAGDQLGNTLSTIALGTQLTFNSDGSVMSGLNPAGMWLHNPQPGQTVHAVMVSFVINHNYTTVVDAPQSGRWATILNGDVSLTWGPIGDGNTGVMQGTWSTPTNGKSGSGGMGWGGPGGYWAVYDANPHVSGTNQVSVDSRNGLPAKVLTLGNSGDFLKRWKRKDLNYTAPDYCQRIPT